MEKRRENFYGLQIKVAILKFSLGILGPADLSDSVKFFPNNNTYDAILASGTFISLFIALFEFFGKKHQIQKKEKYTTTIHERNSMDESIKEILNDMSKDEIEKTFQRILQNLNQDSREVNS